MFEEEIVNGYNISIFRVSKLNGGITMKFYICPESQTVVEVVAGQPAPLTCDGKPMEELVPNSTNAAVEKHMPVLLTETDNEKYTSQVIWPIVAEGDTIGTVMLLSTTPNSKMNEVEMKVVQSAAGFLGKQMEE